MKKLLKKFAIALLFFVSMLALTLVSGRSTTALALGGAGPSSLASAGFRWEMTVQLSPGEKDTILQNSGPAVSALHAKGVSAAINDSTLTLNGQDSLDQMRAALFDTASPLTDFLSGPVELTFYMPAGDTPVTLNLEARITTGARWEVVGDPNSLYTTTASSTFKTRYNAYGAPSIQTIRLQPKGSGNTVVRLIYRRPFRPAEATHAKLNIWLSSVNPTIEISNPNPVAPKAETAAPNSASPDPYAGLLPKALPASWDWRNYGIVPDVRDQGGCGSCWAFGTVGAMESAIAKAGGGLTDLSEQFLVSCNWEGWSCENGGMTADKYHYNTLANQQSQIGAVLESADPYTGTDGSCTAYAHPYKLGGWSFVNNGNDGSHPTVAQIKNAIYTYGPVTAAVCADGVNWNGNDYTGWYDYTGGVYNPPAGTAQNNCYGGTDHMIVIVGWDDTTKPASWIVRNSWGSAWGENGYMNLAYDPYYKTSHIGEGASWVTMQAAAPRTLTLYRPNGATYASQPTYSWSQVSGASSYTLQVYDPAARSYPVNITVSSSYCSGSSGRCTYAPGVNLALNKKYEWRVAAGSGSYAAFVSFTVMPNFSSQFNGDSVGWVVRPGAAWYLGDSTYYTDGLPGKWSSTSYNTNFSNFTYEVNMQRIDTSGYGYSSGLVVRGTPKFDASDNWRTGYEFLYTSEYQSFSVWKAVNGVWTSLTPRSQPWLYTGAIALNDWNRLRVTADGSQLRFYINDVLVWSGSDKSLVNGAVGTVIYDSQGGRLNLDWATLGMSDLFNSGTLAGIVQPGQVQINPANTSNNPDRAR